MTAKPGRRKNDTMNKEEADEAVEKEMLIYFPNPDADTSMIMEYKCKSGKPIKGHTITYYKGYHARELPTRDVVKNKVFRIVYIQDVIVIRYAIIPIHNNHVYYPIHISLQYAWCLNRCLFCGSHDIKNYKCNNCKSNIVNTKNEK